MMNSMIMLSLSKKNISSLGEMVEDLKDVCVAKDVREGKFGVEFV